jgi:hypothetical protein
VGTEPFRVGNIADITFKATNALLAHVFAFFQVVFLTSFLECIIVNGWILILCLLVRMKLATCGIGSTEPFGIGYVAHNVLVKAASSRHANLLTET